MQIQPQGQPIDYSPLDRTELLKSGIARYIDHTLLKPEATPADIDRLCREAIEHQFAGVCVNTLFVGHAALCLEGSSQKVIAVVDFPLGAGLPKIAEKEALLAVKSGAQEIDTVIPIGLLKAGNSQGVLDKIKAVVQGSEGRLVKVIIETGLLNDDEKKLACTLAVSAGAQYVKTCTGFAKGAAEVSDIRLMKAVVGNSIGVKASGGIRSSEQALDLLLAGAHRLGTSSGPSLVAKAEGPRSIDKKLAEDGY